LAENLIGYALAVVLYVQPDMGGLERDSDISFGTVRVTMDVGQGFLKGAEESDFHIAMEPTDIGRQIEMDVNPASLGESFDEPASCGGETGLVEQGRMKEMRDSTSLSDAAIDDLIRLFDEFGSITIGHGEKT
jgi:hypothetical protein